MIYVTSSSNSSTLYEAYSLSLKSILDFRISNNVLGKFILKLIFYTYHYLQQQQGTKDKNYKCNKKKQFTKEKNIDIR